MNKRKRYTNRGKSPIVLGDVTIQPGATVALNESLWEIADERAGLYRDLSETVEQIVELVK